MLIVQKLHENITRRMQKMQIYAKIHKIHEPLADESDKHIRISTRSKDTRA